MFKDFKSDILTKDPRVLVHDTCEGWWEGDLSLKTEDVVNFVSHRHAPFPEKVLVEERRNFDKAMPFYVFFPADTSLSLELRAILADQIARYFLGDSLG